ncbi:MAG TPA: hypothetical protein VH413_17510 [Verrucomicrobiae bacterium]|jgi:hypothetical protein|nr:hypothetical protein [Verrucomicrobiae bacterium]
MAFWIITISFRFLDAAGDHSPFIAGLRPSYNSGEKNNAPPPGDGLAKKNPAIYCRVVL